MFETVRDPMVEGWGLRAGSARSQGAMALADLRAFLKKNSCGKGVSCILSVTRATYLLFLQTPKRH